MQLAGFSTVARSLLFSGRSEIRRRLISHSSTGARQNAAGGLGAAGAHQETRRRRGRSRASQTRRRACTDASSWPRSVSTARIRGRRTRGSSREADGGSAAGEAPIVLRPHHRRPSSVQTKNPQGGEMEVDDDAREARLEEKCTPTRDLDGTTRPPRASRGRDHARVLRLGAFPGASVTLFPSHGELTRARAPCPNFHALRLPAARKWQQLNAKRYGTSRKFGYVEPKKEEMPPEVRPRDRTPSPRAGSPPSVFFPARARADVTSRAGIRSDPIWMLAAARRSWSPADVVPRSSLSIPPSSPYVPRSTCARS